MDEWTSRLERLLNLTGSDNDHEALSAIRAANAMLQKANKRWGDILGNAGYSIHQHPFQSNKQQAQPWQDVPMNELVKKQQQAINELGKQQQQAIFDELQQAAARNQDTQTQDGLRRFREVFGFPPTRGKK